MGVNNFAFDFRYLSDDEIEELLRREGVSEDEIRCVINLIYRGYNNSRLLNILKSIFNKERGST